MSSDFEIVPCATGVVSTPAGQNNNTGHHQWTSSAAVLDHTAGTIRAHRRNSDRNCCIKCWTAGCNWITSAVGVSILLLLYLILGAVMFMVLGNDPAYRTTVRRSESGRGGGGGEPSFLDYDPDGQLLEKTTATVDRLWSITEDLNILYRDNWTHLARNEMRHYQAEIVHALRRIMLEERYSIRQTWSFPMSLLYALTLVTTIGYGYYTPSTLLARSLTTAYSIVGIPLFMLYLSVVGERLARIITQAACCCCCCCCCFRRGRRRAGSSRSYEHYNDVTLMALQPMGNGHVAQLEMTASNVNGSTGRTANKCCSNQVPLLMCAALLAVFIGTGSLLLGIVEPELGFMGSLYLLVNLLLTLGFAGNVLPGMTAEHQPGGKANQSGPPQGSLILVTILILLGTTLLSSSFNVVMEASRSSSSTTSTTTTTTTSTSTSHRTALSTYQHMPSPSRQIA